VAEVAAPSQPVSRGAGSNIYREVDAIRLTLRVSAHLSQRTPNEIRTRAATLKGWKTSEE